MFTDTEHMDALRALLELSRTQDGHLQSGRLAEALSLQSERESITGRLKGMDMADDKAASLLIDEILDNDRRLMLLVSGKMSEISGNLQKRSEARHVISAYNQSSRT